MNHKGLHSSRPAARGFSARASQVSLLAGSLLLLWVACDSASRRLEQRQGRRELENAAVTDLGSTSGVHQEASQVAAPVAPAPRPGAAVARIIADGVKVDAVAFEGIGDAILKKGAGHFPGTALPGQSGNASFAAHRDSFFRGLRDIEIGDEVEVQTARGTWIYEVRERRVVKPSQVGVVASSGRDELTLVTCFPFDYVGPAPQRFVVHADLRQQVTLAP